MCTWDGKLLADRFQELGDAEFGVDDDRALRFFRELLQKASAYGGFAGTDVAGEEDETAVLADTVEKVGQRFPMLFAHIEITGIGSNCEWFFFESEILYIHDEMFVRENYWGNS